MTTPTAGQINTWARHKFGDDTGVRAYAVPAGLPAICNPCHGWVRALSDAEIRAVKVWSISPSQPAPTAGEQG